MTREIELTSDGRPLRRQQVETSAGLRLRKMPSLIRTVGIQKIPLIPYRLNPPHPSMVRIAAAAITPNRH
jgi:hypothetical protein